MFSIGLHLARPAGLIDVLVDPYLLTRRFDFRLFLKIALALIAAGFKSEKLPVQSLFPAMASLDIFVLTNTRLCGPVACAADDLELFAVDGPDHIEFFDNYFMQPVPPRERFHSNPEDFAGYEYGAPAPYNGPDGPEYDSSAFNPFSPATSLSLVQQLSVLSSFHNYSNTGAFGNYAKQQPPFFQIQDSVNTFALQPHPYFNDFQQPGSGFEGVLSSGTSSDSYASPLDEMFFKKPAGERSTVFVDNSIVDEKSVSRKRKYKGSSPLAPQGRFLTDVIYQDEEGGVDSSELELPCNLKFEPSKKVRLDSLSRISNDDDDRKEFACKHCDASFKVKSYLTRHMRKHNNAKAFVCPFFEESDYEACGAVKNGTKCHPTGGFSRRDTFKTHLRALHFIYPPGTKSSERNTIGGRCAGCFEFFENNADWLKNHIEGGACKGAVGSDEVQVKLESI